MPQNEEPPTPTADPSTELTSLVSEFLDGLSEREIEKIVRGLKFAATWASKNRVLE